MKERDNGKHHSPLLQVSNLKKYFKEQRLFGGAVDVVKAVDGVSFSLRSGETFCLVGESGCGKTTTARLLLRVIEPTAGQILMKAGDEQIDLVELDESQLQPFRKRVQMIFQDPYSSLNPRMSVTEIIGEPLLCLEGVKGKALRDRVKELLEVVGLDVQYMDRYPHAFSGGQRQRIGIARALALNPELIVADEPVSALDLSIQAQITNLMQDLQSEYDLTYLFIAHDLGLVEYIADRVAAMYLGQLVEIGEGERIFESPAHPYTQSLMKAVPRVDPDYNLDEAVLEGEVSTQTAEEGCSFAPRCEYSTEECFTEAPILKDVSEEEEPEHSVACYHAYPTKVTN